MPRGSSLLCRHALLAGAVLFASSPALAARYFNYTIKGQFLTSTGPGKPTSSFPGTFRGSMVWDTQANFDAIANKYAGGWSQWSIGIDANTSQNTYLYTFNSATSGSGCFSSSLTNLNNNVTGPYSFSAVASLPTAPDCRGGGVATSGPN